MRDSLAALFKRAGFLVVGKFADPSAFFARVREQQPHVAVIDLDLRDPSGRHTRDGLSVLREMRDLHPGIHLLVYTGNASPDVIRSCYREGASGYLDKLSDSENVITAVKAVAAGERFFPIQAMRPNEAAPNGNAQTEQGSLLSLLSAREREVLSYVSAGADNLKIATMLQIGERTVKAHVSSLYRKLGPENRTQLALAGLQLGIRPAQNV